MAITDHVYNEVEKNHKLPFPHEFGDMFDEDLIEIMNSSVEDLLDEISSDVDDLDEFLTSMEVLSNPDILRFEGRNRISENREDVIDYDLLAYNLIFESIKELEVDKKFDNYESEKNYDSNTEKIIQNQISSEKTVSHYTSKIFIIMSSMLSILTVIFSLYYFTLY